MNFPKTTFDSIQYELSPLTREDLLQINGGNWIEDTAHFIGFAIGYTAHAVVNAFTLITGNGTK